LVIVMDEKIAIVKEIEEVARSVKLELSEEQLKLLSEQLNNTFSFFAKVDRWDTEKIQFDYHKNLASLEHYHEDIIKPSLPQDAVLGMTRCKQNGYFQVPGIL